MSLQHIPTHIALEMNVVGKMHKCFQMDFFKKNCGSTWAVFLASAEPTPPTSPYGRLTDD